MSETLHPSQEPIQVEIINLDSPEGLSHDDSIAAFYEAWKMPTEVELQQLYTFYDAFIMARDKLTDISLVDRISEVMKQHHWLYFGSAAELPPGVAIIDKEKATPNQTYSQHGLISTEISFHPNDPFTISNQIYRRGLQKLDDERISLRLANPELVEKYHAVITSSPQYQFLSSFSQKSDKVSERRLTLFERQVEAATAEGDIRRKYGMAESARLDGYSLLSARQELSRKIYQIDDSTKQVKQSLDSPVERAKKFFLEDMQQWAASEMPATVTEISSNILVKNKIEPFFRERYAENLSSRLGSDDTDIYDGDRLISAYIERLFNSDNPTNDLDECLEYSLSRFNLSQSTVANLLSERFIPAERLINLRGGRVVNKVFLQDHNQELKPVRFFELQTSDKIFIESRARITSQADFEAQENHVLSFVERSEDLQDTHNRLIEFDISYKGYRSENREQLLEAPTDRYDLRLTFTEPTKHMGRIQGYELVAVRDKEMYFVKSPAPDPYEIPHRKINDHERQRMVELAGTYGASEFAKFLKEKVNLTMADLVIGIKRTSDYTFDESINDETGPIPGVGLKSGRLQMQCDGAAVVLRAMLESMDEGYAVIIGGSVLDINSKTVSASSHVEVEWRDSSDNIYRLDATPGESASIAEPEQVKVAQRRFIGRLITKLGKTEKAAKTESASSQKTQPVAYVAPDVIEVESPQPTAANLSETLELNLRALVGAKTNEELYEKTVKLAEADPVRRTLEAAMQIRQYPTTEIDLARLSGYLGNLSQADDKILKQLGITKYQSGTLQMLQSFVQQLSSLPKV